MKRLILATLSIAILSAVTSHAENDKYLDYSDACKASVSQVAKDKKVDALHATNLELDLDELDQQIKLALDKDEDEDFRLMVFGVADMTRQSVVYELGKINETSPELVSEIVTSCQLSNLEAPITEFYVIPYLSIMMGISEEELREIELETRDLEVM